MDLGKTTRISMQFGVATQSALSRTISYGLISDFLFPA